MDQNETIEEFYRRKFDWMPENLRNDLGHFNVFRLDPFVGSNARPIPYKRRDYFKITLLAGGGRVHYADRVIEVKKQALSFSNPFIPYKWEDTGAFHMGVFCIFNQHFFKHFGDLSQYSVFQPGGTHIFELNDMQFETVSAIYNRMFTEINSDYVHKYDLLRNLVYEILHFAMKMQPARDFEKQKINASQRISMLFLELLERQFPIDESHRKISQRTPSDFAHQLAVHVNHLNRAVKEITQRTTTQIIADRLLQESKILLKHNTWPVSDIAWSLGFTEVTHFNNFFKKHTQQSPLKFRNL